MLASTGYVVQGAGFHFPGELAHGTTFESLSAMKPFDAWDAVPDAGKAQVRAGAKAGAKQQNIAHQKYQLVASLLAHITNHYN